MNRAWKEVLVLFVSVRLAAWLIGALAFAVIPLRPGAHFIDKTQVSPASSKAFQLLAGVWDRWDAHWYVELAQNGYAGPPAKFGFMPAYPLAIRGIHALTRRDWLVCALIVSNAAFLAALYFLRRLLELDHDPALAARAVLYLAIFPGSVFFLAPYTESLYLALTAYSFYAARQDRWGRAALAGSVLGATRIEGVLQTIPLAIEAFAAPGAGRARLKRVLCAGGPAFGTAAMMAYSFRRTGDPLFFVHANNHSWNRSWHFPGETLWRGLVQAWNLIGIYPGEIYQLEALATVFAAVMAVIGLKKLRASYSAYLWLQLSTMLCVAFEGRWLIAAPRHVSVLFPAFLVLAGLCERAPRERFVTALFAGLYALCVGLFVTEQWLL